MAEYTQPKCDPSVVAILRTLRKQAGLSQSKASCAAGLGGVKSRDTVSNWELGKMVPEATRRPDLLIYLLDSLRLRRAPADFDKVWNDVMVGQWGWPAISDDEWNRLFPGRSRTRIGSPLPVETRAVMPPRPVFPPNVDGFVGRASELDQLRITLRSSHRLALTGLPGAGKTWLAAYLAIRLRDPGLIFWHSFRPGEDGSTLIWLLAGFLYWRGHKELWLMLQGGQTGRNQPPLDLLVDYLAEWLPENGYLLCLDDFQYVDEDQLINRLLDRLVPALDGGKLSLLLTSRRIPPLREDLICWPVPGLSVQDASELLKARDIILSEGSLTDLNAATAGNPEVLCLAANELRAGTDPQWLIRMLAQTDSIARPLMRKVDKRLSEVERDVMIAVAVVGPCTREAIEAVSGAQRVAQALRTLQENYLLHFMAVDVERRYDLHALLRPFYLDAPSPQRRTLLHTRAGEYYEQKEEELRAAFHFLQARQYERSALLVTKDVWSAANRGQLHIARQVLMELSASSLVTAKWPTVWAALGQVYVILRETSDARRALERAYELQSALPVSMQAREQKAIICRSMADILKSDAPREALEWLRKGQAEIAAGLDDPAVGAAQSQLRLQAAALHVEAGSVYSKLGEFLTAISELEQGLALLPDMPTAVRAAGLINLGIIYCIQGKTGQGIESYRQSLEISQELGDKLRVLSARHDLAIEMDIAGEWETASKEHREALGLARELGSRKHQAQITLSLGILETKRGNYETAGELLAISVAKARESGLRDHVVAAQSSLAQLKLRQGAPEVAGELLAAAEALATEIEARDQLPEIWRGQAEAALALEQTDTALETIGRSIELAAELGLESELGMSKRVLGQILSVRGEEAHGAFEESLSHLRSQDPYEAARTEAQWGMERLRCGDRDGAMELLAGARAAFLKLGAHRDLAGVESGWGRLA